MGEFCSQLFRNLADAADITYQPNLNPNDPVFFDERGKPIFTNADALRMDRMKTAIIRLLLLRACNFMRITKQDSISAEADRCARAEFSFELRTTNIMHKDKPESTATFLGGGAGSRPASSYSDVVDRVTDDEINNILENFIRDVDYTNKRTGKKDRHPRLMFNCPP